MGKPAAAGEGGGAGGLIIALVLMTVIGGGGGAGLGYLLPLAAAPAKSAVSEPVSAEGAATPEMPAEVTTVVQPLPPIVTNLGSGPAWIRLEASLLIDAAAKSEGEVMAAEAAARIQAFLHTLTVSQIEGPSGLLHFREDLLDLLQAATDGKVRQIAISSLVVE